MCRSSKRSAPAPRIEYDFLDTYVADLGNVIDFDAIRASGIRMGVDPLGGAGVHYWARIAEHYRHRPHGRQRAGRSRRFGFMTLDWDGRIRMDPSSSYAMQRLIGLKDKYDIAFACDTDHDRHGIVAPSGGLMPPNHYLAVAIDYLFRNRPRLESGRRGRQDRGQQRHDRPGRRAARPQALRGAGRLQMVCRRACSTDHWDSAARKARARPFCGATAASGRPTRTASPPRCCPPRSRRGPAATRACSMAISRATSATMTADRVDAPATAEQKQKLAKLSPQQVRITELAGEPITSVISKAPGNDAPIGGIKVVARQRMVCRSSVRHRGDLQDLCRELPRQRPSEDPAGGSASHRRQGAGTMSVHANQRAYVRCSQDTG